jgi:hypothetical protein
MRSEGNSRSGSVQGRRSGEIMGIAEEEEEEEEEIEEVEEFSPVLTKEGEFVEEVLPSALEKPPGVEKPLPLPVKEKEPMQIEPVKEET